MDEQKGQYHAEHDDTVQMQPSPAPNIIEVFDGSVNSYNFILLRLQGQDVVLPPNLLLVFN